MRSRRHVVFVFVLFVGLSVPAVAGGTVQTGNELTGEITITRTGETTVSYNFSFDARDSRVEQLAISVWENDADVAGSNGFTDEPQGAYYRATGESETPWIRFTNDVSVADMSIGNDDWLFATSMWGRVTWYRHESLFRDMDRTGSRWTYDVPEGTVSPGGYVYLGEYEEYRTESASHEDIRLVVPENTDVQSPRGTLEFLSNASAALDVDNVPDSETTVFYRQPSDDRTVTISHNVGARAGAYDHNVEISDEASDTTLLHEYVHTRQDLPIYGRDSEMEWLREASAQYYQYYTEYELDRRSIESVREELTDRDNREAGDGVLAEQDSVYSGVNYHKGSTVVAYLDQRIYELTDGERSFEDVFERLNGRENVTTVDQFAGVVEDVVGNDTLDDDIDRYVTTDANPVVEEDIYVRREVPIFSVDEHALAETDDGHALEAVIANRGLDDGRTDVTVTVDGEEATSETLHVAEGDQHRLTVPIDATGAVSYSIEIANETVDGTLDVPTPTEPTASETMAGGAEGTGTDDGGNDGTVSGTQSGTDPGPSPTAGTGDGFGLLAVVPAVLALLARYRLR